MAEADIGSSSVPERRYYCHHCNRQIRQLSLPDYQCPHCSTGFVEELPEGDETVSSDGSFFERTAQASETPFSVDRSLFSLPIFHGLPAQGEGRQRLSFRVTGGPRNDLETTMAENPIDQFVHQLFLNLGMSAAMDEEGGGVFGRIYPRLQLGDYAWGQNGLDNIISQLLSQFEGTGPPPAEKDKIEELPFVTIDSSDIESGMSCAVCKDEYIINERVLKLPCKHLFHDECVKPWLELHDSCPVCRCSLDGESTTQYS